MSGASSRNKGARGEREIIALLQPAVDEVCDTCGHVRLVLRRNYAQRFESKLYDVEGIPWMALEVKRHEDLKGLTGWWKQVKEATRPGQIPVLFYRQNNSPWKVRTRLPIKVTDKISVTATVTMDFNQWVTWFKKKIESQLMKI